MTGEMRSLMSGTGWLRRGTGPSTPGRRTSTRGTGKWTPAPRSLAFPLKGLEHLHSGLRPVPDGRTGGRTERSAGNGLRLPIGLKRRSGVASGLTASRHCRAPGHDF